MKKLCLIVIALLPLLAGCDQTSQSPYSRSGMYFDTVVSVDIYGPEEDPDIILDECMNLCSHYEQLFDKNIPTSDIARINSGRASTTSVDHDTAVLIDKAIEYSRMTDGQFDITIAPVSALWDFHPGSEQIPSDADIRKALHFVDYHNITVDTVNDTVTTLTDNIRVDVGAVAKGYIADRIADHLGSYDIDGAIINMGGDIRMTGSKSDKENFIIGINDPFDSGNCIEALSVSDTAVATSGLYERSFVTGRNRYHHILSVDTGYPVDTDVESVTVITADAVDADCLCTVAIISGSAKAMELMESLDSTEAILVLSDRSILMTSGAGRYIRQ